MVADEQIKHKIINDEDFIAIKRFDYSIKRILERYPNGVPDKIIAQALLMTEEEVATLYQNIIAKLKAKMKIE